MDAFVIFSLVYALFSTYFICSLFFLNEDELFYKKNNSKYIIFVLVIFVSYLTLFYIVETSLPSKMKYWHYYDSFLIEIGNMGIYIFLFKLLKRIINFIKKITINN